MAGLFASNPAAAAYATTQGSGGAFTDRRDVYFAASNGYSSYYHVWASHIDFNQPIGLMTWYHGDGAYEYEYPDDVMYIGGTGGILEAAKEKNMILVVPLTPDDTNWTWWHWGSKTGNAQFAKELVDDFSRKYNISRGKIWFGGFSGGSEFLTAQFLPYWGNNLGIQAGGVVVTGGGDQASEYGGNTSWVPNLGNFRAYWYVGENDTAANSEENWDGRAAAEAGAAWFDSLGIPTELYHVPNRSHLLSGMYGGFMREAMDHAASFLTGPPQEVEAVYVGGTMAKGLYLGSTPIWLPHIIREFTSPGEHRFQAPRGKNYYCDYLVVAGGGGGGGVYSTTGRGGEGGKRGAAYQGTWPNINGGEFVVNIGLGGQGGGTGLSDNNGTDGQNSKVAIGYLSKEVAGGAGGPGNRSSAYMSEGDGKHLAEQWGLQTIHGEEFNLSPYGGGGDGNPYPSPKRTGYPGESGYAWVRFRPM